MTYIIITKNGKVMHIDGLLNLINFLIKYADDVLAIQKIEKNER